MRIVFMGTPDYSVKTLEALIAAKHNIVGVFAQPDKPVGRKHILTAPPVKVCAENHGIPVYQPNTLKNGEAADIIKRLSPDIIVVVAYGKILPQEILDIPKYGCINGHASLLPRYRGASPIQWCIVCGENETGVTVMQMDSGMDTGDILNTEKTEIGGEETADELFERLSVISAQLTAVSYTHLTLGTVTPKKQDEEKATYAPIIKKEMALIDFKNMTADEAHNAVRGYYSWPCAYFFFDNKRVKIIKAVCAGKSESTPGTVVKSNDELVIACKDGGLISLLTVQPEGSKPMSAKQMLCGRPIAAGTVIGE
mgnify:FL=1